MAKNRVEIWLKDWDDLYMQIPVNPSEIEYSSPYGMNTVSIASLGDVIVPGERGNRQITFSSFFPRDYNPSYCEYEGFKAPWEWVEQIEKWRDIRKNLRIIISGTPISIPVYISEFTMQPEKAGNPGDVHYNITFIEYRPIRAEIVQAKKPIAGMSMASTRPISAKTQAKTYVVMPGDSLYLIALKVYGDGGKLNIIHEANKATIGKYSDGIKPGQKLVIP